MREVLRLQVLLVLIFLHTALAARRIRYGRAQTYDRPPDFGGQAIAQEMQGGLSLSGLCRADERACGNNECVKADYVCDGEPDCRDRSDEQNCPSLRQCEPNEFKCNNGRCVQKMWLCDGDDDCGDNSDEQQCRQKASSDGCGPTEFRCRDGRQCVLSSFHCDGTNDCQDGSDEVGCVQPTVVEAPETNKQVPAGGTFQLTCRAVAVPEPYINWRLNWGPVCDPPRCVQHSEGGLGTLTVNNAQPLDQGAYTCEAINVKGRVLATPDCIVRIVNIPAPSYEPRPPAQVQCDIAGSVNLQPGYGGQCQCKGLVTGPSCNQCVPGSYHLHDKAPQGCLKCFCFGITDQCRSSTWYRSKDKLTFNGDPQGVALTDFDERDTEQNGRFDYIYPGMITYSNGRYGESVKYWRMPQRFLGNKLSSYGGELAFDMQHSCSGSLITEPLVVIKGNRITLVHRPRNGVRSIADRTERVTIDTYENNYEHEDGRPASREDLMMVLADLESFLIRATHCDGQRSTSLGDVSWEIAVDRDTQDRLAVEVEQCSCPPGYTGLSCEDCAPGYERSGQGPYLGTCVPARQGPQCSAAGAISTQPSYAGTCQCKTYATGPLCDQCPPNSFYMSAENPHGCIPCFCSGVTQQCSSSGYSRVVVEINYPQGTRDQLEVTTSDAHTPFQPQSRPQLTGRDITFSTFYETPGQTLYWKMPTPFLGNKVTSYGGTLKYVFRYSGTGPLNGDPDVILRGNDITLYFKNRQPTHPERDNTVEVKLFEDHWHRVDGQQATREHLLMTLADLDALLIKMNYLDDCSSSSLISVSLEHAEPRHTGGQIAYEVEQCVCPPGYIGTSCEDCAPGYSRTGGGLYLGLCERCECHGHATQCDKEHGFCVDCQHNTEGDQCERCKPGFMGDPRRGTPHDCQPAATRPPCNCNNHSPRGCDSFGRCLMCEHNTEGYHCEQCKKGFYGDATRGTPFDCTPCPCPATSDCFLDAYGQVQCRNCPAGFSGRLCDECAPGYTRSRTHGGRDCEPIGRVGPSDVVFVPTPEAPLRVQIDPPKNLQVPRGGRAQWYCHIVGHSGPNLRLEWTKVGTNTLPDSAVQTNGQLVIEDVRESDSGQYRCTATGPHQFATDDATLIVTKPQPKAERKPLADTTIVSIQEGGTVKLHCTISDKESDELHWRREDGGFLPYDAVDSYGVLTIQQAQLSDSGIYICYSEDSITGERIDSTPTKLEVIPVATSEIQRVPVVETPTVTVEQGETIRLRCNIPTKADDIQLHWRREDGRALRWDISEDYGLLIISNVQPSDAGAYICSAEDMETGETIDSAPAYITVNPSALKGVTPHVESTAQSFEEGETITLRCTLPDKANAELHWRREDGNSLGYDATDEDGILTMTNVKPADSGAYICSAEDHETGERVDSVAAYITITPRTTKGGLATPLLDTTSQIIQEGDTVTFRCTLPSLRNAHIHWRRQDGSSFGYDVTDEDGILTIPRVESADAGAYICTVEDPETGESVESAPAYLTVNPSTPRQPEVDPPTQSVDEGETVAFRCSVPGVDDAVIHWRREDGSPLGYGVTDEDGVLTIPRAEPSDAGTYVCWNDDPRGGAPIESQPAYLTVNPAPPKSPIVDASSDSVNEGAPVRFRCYVPGASGAQLEWRREDGNALNDKATDENGILTIMQTKASDAGAYVCSAKSPDGGRPVDSSPIHLNVVPTPPRAPIVLSAEETVDEGSPIRLRCYLPGSRDAELHWRREDGNPLGKDATDEQGILTIPRARTSDAGAYICSAKEPESIESLDSQPARINVNAMELPTLVVETSSDSVSEGQAVRLQCHAPGRPDVELHWRREDGASLSSSATEQRGILTIMQTQPSDSGTYICSTGQPGDDNVIDSSPVHLTVTRRLPQTPVVDASSESVTEGQPVRLQCHVPGRPDLELKWRRDDDKPLSSSAVEQRGTLTIMRTETSDSGAYICSTVVTNGENAIHSSPIHLTVASSKPKGPLLVTTEETVNEGDLVRLRCYLPGQSDNGLHWRRQDGNALSEDTTDEHGILTIPRASPSDSGYYICSFGHPPVDSPPARITVNAVTPGVPVVEPLSVSISVGHAARFRCYVPGNPRAELHWRKQDGRELGIGITETQGYLSISRAQQSDAGAYVCSAQSSPGGSTVDSQPVSLTVNPIAPTKPVVNPPTQTIDEGGSARYQCYVPGNPGARLNWRREDGVALGYDVTDNNGILTITNARISDAGAYICSATDQQTGSAAVSSPVYLSVNQNRPVSPVVDPQSQTVDEGASARFRCHVPGNPDAQLRWRKEDGSAFGYGVTDSQGVLSFARVAPSDAGAYICTAQGPRGVSPIHSSPAYLGVNPRRPSNPVVEPPTQTISEGDPAKFRCYLPGVPDAQLSWRKQDGSSLGHTVTDSRGLLSFPRVQPSDAGAYVCTAQDQRGGSPTDSPPAYLNVNPRRPPQPPRVDPPEMTVNDGDPARFRCWVPGDPAARLSWRMRSGEPIPYGAQENEGILNFPRARHSHAGGYVCTATDPDGRNPPIQSPEVRLNIKQPITPQIDPYEQTVSENEPSRIRCWVPGNPSATLKWRKHGANLPEEAEDRGGVLLIPRTTLHDAGNYICSAQISPGGPSVDAPPALINVRRPEAPRYEPPVRAEKPSERPIVDPPEQTVNEGEPVRFRCYVPNEQSARVRWSYGRPDGPLPPYVQDDRGLLTIRRADSTHSGEYFCTYDAPEGALHSAPARLRVNKPGGPPRPEASPADQTVQTGERARFHCDANSQTPARIRWGYRAPDGPLRGDVVQEGDDVVINSADESNAGEYICTATNEYGTGEAAPVRLHVTENEEPPTARVVPRVWNGKPGDRHQFRCITTGVPPPQVTWTGPDGAQLPDDVNDIGGGVLDFSNGRADLNGDYTCTAVNIVGEASDHGSVNIGPSLTVRTTPPGPKIVLTAGEPLEVKCEAFGEPEPEVEWLHDPGPERGDLPDDFKPVTISEQFIRHPSIGIGNAGVYTCKGSNSQATATKDIHVEVVEASRVATVAILGGSTQWLEPGSPTEIICAATGNSIIDRIQWVKTDGDLPPDVEDHNEPGILHFANFKSSDSGVYECRGYRNDEQIASAQVTIHPTNGGPLGAARVEIDEPNIRVVNHGDSIVLKCSVHGGENNGANFEWALLRSGSVVRQLSRDDTLTIKRADASNDFGVYRCEVEDDDGQLLGAAYTAVTIAHSGSSNAQIVKFDEKSEATITCPVYAVPGAEVTWEKQDGSLPDDAVTSRNKLLIQEFNDAATGTYICRVSVEGQEIEGYVTALIYVPDTIIQVLLEASSESVALGDRAWFDCKVAGDPDAVITWSREGEEDLPDNAQVTGNRLLFVNVREDNGGIYKCHAETKEGPLETRTVLNVGSTKRKRKHLHRNLKPSLRMHRNVPQKKKRQQSVFGSWFTSV